MSLQVTAALVTPLADASDAPSQRSAPGAAAAERPIRWADMRRNLSILGLLISTSCGTVHPASESLAERLASLPQRFPDTVAYYYEQRIRHLGPFSLPDAHGRVVFRSGNLAAVRLDDDSPSPGKATTMMALFLGHTYKAELLVLETYNEHVLGYLFNSQPGQEVRVGDRASVYTQ